MSRLFAVPDIHGRLDLLEKLLEILFTQHALDLAVDKLIFLGDMVDRGPDSFGVLDRIYKLTLLHPANVIALAGNHEWMMINYYIRRTSDDIDLWESNGGLATKDSLHRAGYSWCPEYLLKWMAFLPLKHEEPGFFFSHAPAPAEGHRRLVNRAQAFTPDELTWTFSPDERGVARIHDNGVIGVCGHVHALRRGLKEPRFYDHYIYADAGCGCRADAPLCAIEVKTREVIYAWP